MSGKGHRRSESEESFDEADLDVQNQHSHHHQHHQHQQQHHLGGGNVVVGRPLSSSGRDESSGFHGSHSAGNSGPQRQPSSLAAAFLGLPQGTERKSPAGSDIAGVKRSVSDEFVNKSGNATNNSAGHGSGYVSPPNNGSNSYATADQQQYFQQHGYYPDGSTTVPYHHLGAPTYVSPSGSLPRAGVPAPPSYLHSYQQPQSSSLGGAGPTTPMRHRGFSNASSNGSSSQSGYVGGNSGPTLDDGGRIGQTFNAPAPLPSFMRKPGSNSSVGGNSGSATPNPQQPPQHQQQQQPYYPPQQHQMMMVVMGDQQQQLMPPPQVPFFTAGGGGGGGSNNSSPVGGVPIPSGHRRTSSGGAGSSSAGNSLPGSAGGGGGGGAGGGLGAPARFSGTHNPYAHVARSPNRSPKESVQ